MQNTFIPKTQYESILAYVLLRLPDNYWLARFAPDELANPIPLTKEMNDGIDKVGKELFEGVEDFYANYVTY